MASTNNTAISMRHQTKFKPYKGNKMSIYQSLLQNPPKLVFVPNSRQVIFNLVSCMCDNKHTIAYDLDKDNLSGYSISNLQLKGGYYDLVMLLEQALAEDDAEAFAKSVSLINTGTSKVASVQFRPKRGSKVITYLLTDNDGDDEGGDSRFVNMAEIKAMGFDQEFIDRVEDMDVNDRLTYWTQQWTVTKLKMSGMVGGVK